MSGRHPENLMRHLKRKHLDDYNDVMKKKKKCKSDAADISKYFDNAKITVAIKRQDVIDGCLELVTKNGRTLTILEDSGFKKITKPLFEAFTPIIRINRQNVRELIIKKASDIRNDIKKRVKNRLISLKVDCATRLDRSILGVNIQLIIEEKIQIFTLAMKEIHQAHTGHNLSVAIMDVLRDYDISLSQIYTLTVDNGRNIVRAGAILNDLAHAEENNNNEVHAEENNNEVHPEENNNEVHPEENNNNEDLDDWELLEDPLVIDLFNDAIITLRCACHTLQLAVKDFVEEIRAFLPKVRVVVKKLRTPTIYKITKVQKLPKAILDCPTRWSSTFLMCQQLLLFKNFCDESSTDIKELYLSPSYWTKLDDFVQILRPIHEVTLELQ